MTHDFALLSPQRLRVWRDIHKRAKPGLVVYPLFWGVIAWSSGFANTHPATSWSMLALFLLASLLRWRLMRQLVRCSDQHFFLWRAATWVCALVQCCAWGSMFGVALLAENADFLFLMAFSCAGIAAGGTNSFAPDRALACSFVSFFIAPSLLVSVFLLPGWTEAVMIAIYLVYMLNLAKQQHREYWHSLDNEIILEQQSRTDALTSLKNRRYFDEKLDELCHLSSRDHVKLAVLVVDCDHFKSINDNFGHDFGDECLRQLGKILSDSLPRATDVCARYGGEEFSVILAGTGLTGAQLVAERIRARVAAHRIEYQGRTTQLTVSIGVTAERLQQFEEGLPERLFKRADLALYQAKREGRNCVRCAETDLDVEAQVSAV